MNSIKKVWEGVVSQLEKAYDRRESENISYILLEDAFDLTRADILSGVEREIDQPLLKGYIDRLLNHEPLQYITGIADFFGRKFHISLGALIPRPETEELVELVIQENSTSKPRIVDIGSGSGCIAITLKLALQGEVFGVDVSGVALQIANKNAEALDANVQFFKHDVLEARLSLRDLDVVVSNPPYIPYQEQEQMRSNVLHYEPEIALFVPDNDPLIFYRRIAEEGIQVLKSGGKLYFELNERLGQETKELLERLGYVSVKIHQDMQGKDRMLSAIKA